MRVALVVFVSAVVSFVVTGWMRQRSTEGGATLVGVHLPERNPLAPYQPPPLDLPIPATCTQSLDPLEAYGGDGGTPSWTPSGVERQLRAHTEVHDDVELIDVDCSDDPCIAWLWWAQGCTDPEIAYRWWSLEGVRAAALWTRSRTFAVPREGRADGTLQAVSVAPARVAPEVSQTWRRAIDARVHARVDRLVELVEANGSDGAGEP